MISNLLILSSVLSAIIVFLLARLELRDKRKRYLGFRVVEIKGMFSYIIVISSVLVILLEAREQIDDKLKLIGRYRKEDSTARANIDTTLRAISFTLGLQKKTISSLKQVSESNTRILERQEGQIKYLKRLLTEADGVTGLKLDIDWKLENEMEAKYYANLHPFDSVNYAKSYRDFEGHTFSTYGDRLKIPPLIRNVNIYFAEFNSKKETLIKEFLLDTIQATKYDSDMPPIADKIYFKHFQPRMSLGTAYYYFLLDSSSSISYFAPELVGRFSYRTMIFSKDNEPPPFSELNKLYSIVIVNSKISNLIIEGLMFKNASGNSSLFFKIEQTIYRRKCLNPDGDMYYQDVYLATSHNGWRKD